MSDRPRRSCWSTGPGTGAGVGKRSADASTTPASRPPRSTTRRWRRPGRISHADGDNLRRCPRRDRRPGRARRSLLRRRRDHRRRCAPEGRAPRVPHRVRARRRRERRARTSSPAARAMTLGEALRVRRRHGERRAGARRRVLLPRLRARRRAPRPRRGCVRCRSRRWAESRARSRGATKPSTYVVCTDDRAIPVALQRSCAARIGDVVELPTSHSPFLSRPDELARLLAGLASRSLGGGAQHARELGQRRRRGRSRRRGGTGTGSISTGYRPAARAPTTSMPGMSPTYHASAASIAIASSASWKIRGSGLLTPTAPESITHSTAHADTRAHLQHLCFGEPLPDQAVGVGDDAERARRCRPARAVRRASRGARATTARRRRTRCRDAGAPPRGARRACRTRSCNRRDTRASASASRARVVVERECRRAGVVRAVEDLRPTA